jgi:alkylhydroperoxidase family enzyme
MRGVPDEKISAVWEFETSELYDDAERAALRFARDASLVPNAVLPSHFSELRRFWDDAQIVEMLAVVGIFGFLNRWNDTMATELEDVPRELAAQRLGPRGWAAGKHASG